MDFHPSEEQTMVQGLVREILDKELTDARQQQLDCDADAFDRDLWRKLAASAVLGLTVPEAHGGMGFGYLELCTLMHELGRAVARVPAIPSLVLGALPVVAHGTAAQRERWLPGLVSGETVLSGALTDAGSVDPDAPATSARQDDGGWLLDGTKRFVPALHLAERVVVPVSVGEGATSGVGLFLVDPRADGATLSRHTTSTGDPVFDLVLDDVRVGPDDLIGGREAGVAPDRGSWLHERAVIATCAMQVGVSERAIEITADYVRGRIQFRTPIGSFQAVQHRLADAYMDREAMRWTAWRAADRLSRGEASAREVAVAKFWAAEGGSRIANSAQHLHGGMGVDLDYPIHRYFLRSKALELAFGSATPQLVRLGRDLAASAPALAAG